MSTMKPSQQQTMTTMTMTNKKRAAETETEAADASTFTTASATAAAAAATTLLHHDDDDDDDHVNDNDNDITPSSTGLTILRRSTSSDHYTPPPQKRHETEKWLLVQAYSNYLDDIAHSVTADAEAVAASASASASATTTTNNDDVLLLAAMTTHPIQPHQPQHQHHQQRQTSPLIRWQQEKPILVLNQLLSTIALTVVASPQASPNDTHLQSFCSNSIQALIPTLILPCFCLEAIWTVLRAMDFGQESISLQVEACKVLTCLLEDTTTTLVNNNNNKTHSGVGSYTYAMDHDPQEARLAVRIILRALCRFPHDVNVQCLGLDIVRKLKIGLVHNQQQGRTASTTDTTITNNDDDTTLLVHATSIIFQSHQLHTQVLCIQQVSLSLLAWLVENDACRQVVVNGNGIETIPNAMTNHPHDAIVQCNAAATICWLVHAGGINGRLILHSQHLSTVLHALTRHFNEVTVFGNCICLLCGFAAVTNAAVAHDNNNNNINNTNTLMNEATILQVIRLGMQIHIQSAKALESCLQWIRFRNVETCQEQLVACLPLILQAMTLHLQDVNLQAQAVEVLVMLANVTITRAALLSHGGVDIVLVTLQTHKTNNHIQHAAIWFLTLLLQATTTTTTTTTTVSTAVPRRPEQQQQERQQVNNDNIIIRPPHVGAAAAPRPRMSASTAFGGGFLVLEVLWKGMGI